MPTHGYKGESTKPDRLEAAGRYASGRVLLVDLRVDGPRP